MDVDVLIIGGGIAGLSLAWKLAPGASVAVVEAEAKLAYHSSSRSARQMQPNYGPGPVRELTLRTIEMVEEISAALPSPILLPRPLLTVGSAAEIQSLAASYPSLKTLGHAAAHALAPEVNAAAFEAATLDETAKEVDVPALVEYYRDEAVAAGAVVLTGSPVTSAQADGGRFTVVAGEHEISAAVVVNAAGAWADQVAALFGVRARGLVPYRRSVAIVRTELPVHASGVMVEPADEWMYYRPDGENLLISPCESVPAPAGDAQVIDADITALIARLNALTNWGIGETVSSWTGLRTSPADGLPIVGFDADLLGFFWLAGQGGYGIQTSTALASLAADIIKGTVVDGDKHLSEALSPQRESLR